MTKKIIATFLCLMLTVTLFPVGNVLNAATTEEATITVTADKNVYHRGDTITYTFKIKQIGTLTAYGFNLNVPNSLIYLEHSVNEEARNILGFTGSGEESAMTIDKDKNQYLFTGFGAHPYKGTDEVILGTIKFKIKDNTSYGNLVLDIMNDDDLAAGDENFANKKININKSTVVIEEIKVPSTNVTVAPEKTIIKSGKTVQLNATLSPSNTTDKITWKSENEKIAKVDQKGLVTGAAIGTTKVTATTTSGKVAEATITVTCNHSKTTKHAAVASTCLKQGNEEYHTCDICGEVVKGSNAKLPLADHNYGVWHKEVPAKHENKESLSGTKGYYECSVCGKYFDKDHKVITDLTIPAEPHKGMGEYKYDTNNHWKICGCGILVDVEAHKAGETKKEKVVVATCTKDGSHDEVVYCSVCGYEISRKNVVDKATGHKPAKAVKENEKAATCLEAGNYDEVVYCSVCKEELSRKNIIVKALGHTGGKATCINKAVCTRCNKEYGEIDPKTHTGNVEIKNAKEATLTEEGYTGDKYCKDCGVLIEKGAKTDKFVYKMLEGMNGEHEYKTSGSLTFKSNGKIENLESVYVDENKLTKDVDYSVKSGSTIVTLKTEYLNKLAVGTHTIKMNYTDGGSISTEFKIAEVKKEEANKDKESVTPQTSDNSNMILWVIGTILSGICLVGIIKCHAKKEI